MITLALPVLPRSSLFRLHADVADDLGPVPDVSPHELAEVLAAQRRGLQPNPFELLPHVGTVGCLDDLALELAYDVGQRSRRNEDAHPGHQIELRISRLC